MSTPEPQPPATWQACLGFADATLSPQDRGGDLWLQLAAIDRSLARLYDLQRRSAQPRPV